MPRLDARVKTDLVGEAQCTGKSPDCSKKVIIKELSLSSALIQGLSECGEYVRIMQKLPDGQKVEIEGEVVRTENDIAGLELYHSDMATMEILWDNIRGEVSCQNVCPYCGAEKPIGTTLCHICNTPLDFDDDNYLKKHFRHTFLDRVKSRIDKLDTGHLEKVIKVINKEILKGKGHPAEDEFIGTSPAMLDVFAMIRKVAPSDVNVLVLGESGTGKELTAKAIHERSPRKDKPFVAINSAAIPEGLLEAELFGYEKGAFTGAHAQRKGKFEQADGGTVLLDEIGDMPTGLQATLLRFLEDRIVERIGAKGGKKVDIRIITATNCNLAEMVRQGRFRNDLYYRLDGFTINLPPLRTRGEDVVILAHYVLKSIARNDNSPAKRFSPAAIDIIKSYDWPGNIRELINKVRRGQLMADGTDIEPADMGLQDVIAEAPPGTMKHEVANIQRKAVEKALQDHRFIITRAAKMLGISRPSLYALMKKHNIAKPNLGAEVMS